MSGIEPSSLLLLGVLNDTDCVAVSRAGVRSVDKYNELVWLDVAEVFHLLQSIDKTILQILVPGSSFGL